MAIQRNTRTITLVMLSTGAALSGWFLTRNPARTTTPLIAEAAAETTALPVETVEVRGEPVRTINALSGQVEPFRVATVAAEAANRVVNRPIQQGDHVALGTLLASLDAEAASAQLAQAEAALAQATAARLQAETDYKRAFVETDAARQQARAQVRAAQAERDRAGAGLASAEASERKTRTYTRAQELRQAEQTLAQARSEERLARIEHERYTFLVSEGASPRQVLDRAVTTLETATARRESAEQAVSLAKEGARREDQEAAEAQSRAAASQIRAAEQQIEAAKAGLRTAETRDTRLAVIRRQIDGLRAQEEQARESARQARIALSKRQVTAPFAGRVLATLVDVGDLVSPGTPVARIGEVSRVKATFAVPEASRPSLHLGQPITLTADALPGRTFAGYIHTLGFQADPRTRAFPVEIAVANPGEILLPNMVVRLRLSVGKAARSVRIPAGTVIAEGAETGVFVVENGRAVRRAVTLGGPIGSDVEVLSGLKSGERIALNPQNLRDGARVSTR